MPRATTQVVFSHAVYRSAHNRTPGDDADRTWSFSLRPEVLKLDYLEWAMKPVAQKLTLNVSNPRNWALKLTDTCLHSEAKALVEAVLVKAARKQRKDLHPTPVVIPVEVAP